MVRMIQTPNLSFIVIILFQLTCAACVIMHAAAVFGTHYIHVHTAYTAIGMCAHYTHSDRDVCTLHTQQ